MKSWDLHEHAHQQMKKIKYETGNGLTGHYLGLRSGPIPPSTGNRKNSIPDFRFHNIHAEQVDMHPLAPVCGYTNSAITTLTDQPEMHSQVTT